MIVDNNLDAPTLKWVLEAIDTAPNKQTLEGITYSLEWFSEQGMCIEQLEYFMKRINEAKKLKD